MLLSLNSSPPRNTSSLFPFPLLPLVCLTFVCLAVSLASQHALTCAFIHQSPPALWVNRPPFLVHLLPCHVLADHLSLLLSHSSCLLLSDYPPICLSLLSWPLFRGEGSVSFLLFPAVSSLPLLAEKEMKKRSVSKGPEAAWNNMVKNVPLADCHWEQHGE